MKVYEIKVKVFLLKNLNQEQAQSEIGKIIDSALAKDSKWLEFHKDNKFKNYCFDSLYPISKDKIYKSGEIYTFKFRTIDDKLAKYISIKLANAYNNVIKCLITETKVIPKKFIEKIYSITPVIIKDQKGYWKENSQLEFFEKRLKENLIKKYNEVNDCRINEDLDLYTCLEFINRKPCFMEYKNVKLLGDKISLKISNDKMAQDIAYMALGTGILEANSRGAGFVNYRWL